MRETLAHEVAHVLTPGVHHGIAWRTCFRLLCEEILGVRPKLDVRWHGEVTRKLQTAAEILPPFVPFDNSITSVADDEEFDRGAY